MVKLWRIASSWQLMWSWVWGRRWAQNGFRRPQTVPMGLTWVPRWPQAGPQWLQILAKAQWKINNLAFGVHMALRWPKIGPSWPLIVPRWLQEGLSWIPDSHRRPLLKHSLPDWSLGRLALALLYLNNTTKYVSIQGLTYFGL